MSDDEDLAWWNKRHEGRWHAERTREGTLIASREPERAYHVCALAFSELSLSVSLADDRGGKLVTG